ncbi:MAG: OPT/YSL family transporter [Nanoarchaeota archaeon]|nr:OPT/YSL family transporter [Nanoarchaeota archaeon]
MDKPGLSVSSIIIAILLALFLAASSSYIALKIGAMPWPIIFSVLMSFILLKLFRPSIHNVNVAQAGASIGGLLASAFVFVIPGMWLLQQQGRDIPDFPIWALATLGLLGGLLGLILSVPLRKRFVDRLPFPSGKAGAAVLKTVFDKRKWVYLLLLALVLAGMFAMVRDIYFPAGLVLIAPILVLYPMPLAIGVGYILGKRSSLSWFFGAVIGWLILIPVLQDYYPQQSIGIVQNLGMGLLLGSGLAFVFSSIRKMRLSIPWQAWPIAAALAAVMIFLGVPIIAVAITFLGIYITVQIAARMTGETNIDPLEQFGIFVALFILLVFGLTSMNITLSATFMIVFVVAVATAIAGDIGHDFKSARIIGTRTKDIIIVDIITVVAAALVLPFILRIIRTGFASELFTDMMPAPQAQLVAGTIAGFAHPNAFIIGMLLGIAFELVNIIALKQGLRLRLAVMPLGIGMFLGMGLAIPLAIGGLLYMSVRRWKPSFTYPGLILAAGIMGGEGITGFISAALYAFGGMAMMTSKLVMFGMFGLLLMVVLMKRLIR